MGQNGTAASMQAVNAWIRYLERFGTSEVTVQKLVNMGFDYPEITRMLEEAVASGLPLILDRLHTPSA